MSAELKKGKIHYRQGFFTALESADCQVNRILKIIPGVFRLGGSWVENKFGRKVDILTPDGIKTIRVKRVVERIRESIIYV